MRSTRKSFSKEFKAKVALEAIRGITTTAEIALRYKVHANQITKWKKQALENMAALFADGRSKTNKGDDSQLKDRLYQQIGQLQFELDWLKKKVGDAD
jgi:transposase-like protein